LDNEIRIRQARLEDIQIILNHRRGLFEDMGCRNEEDLETMVATSEVYITRGLHEGSYRGWVAELPSGQVVAGGGIFVTHWPTHPDDPRTERATILNMYTEPKYRRQGFARALMHVMIEWCRAEGFRWVSLHASEDGRPLYESLGFRPTNEMRLHLPKANSPTPS
jgi:GNAT superfamily N-acetyltransferase